MPMLLINSTSRCTIQTIIHSSSNMLPVNSVKYVAVEEGCPYKHGHVDRYDVWVDTMYVVCVIKDNIKMLKKNGNHPRTIPDADV